MSLHCGACNTQFENNDTLIVHIESCAAAKAILLPMTGLMFDNKLDTDHSVAHLIWAIPEARSYISEYAEAIASDMGSYNRSIIHKRMCGKLGVSYTDFRPFESTAITEIPSKSEAENIIYKAIGDIMRSKLWSKSINRECASPA